MMSGSPLWRQLVEGIGIKLDNFGRVTEEKIISLPKEKPQRVGKAILVPAMEDAETDALLVGLRSLGYKGKGINYGRVGAMFDGVEGMDVNDPKSYERMLSNLKKNNEELFEWMRRETLTIQDMMELAEKKGLKNIMTKILTQNRGTPLPAEDVVGGLLIIKRLIEEIRYGHDQLKAIPDTDSVNFAMPQLAEERRLKAKRLQVLAGQLNAFSVRLSASVTESARSLAVLANATKIFEADLAKITQQADALFNEADPRLIDMHVVALTNLDLDQKVSYLTKFTRFTRDAIQELYINSLLSAGPTHAVNIGGTLALQIVRLAERGIAGGIGEARMQFAKLVGKEKERGFDYMDRAYTAEAFTGFIGDIHGLKDAFILSSRAFLRGEASDLSQKLDITAPAIGTTNSIPEVIKDISKMSSMGDFFYSVINIMGIAGRLPGRALLTEDEFFKGIIRRKVIYQEATRRGMALWHQLSKQVGPDGNPLLTREEIFTKVKEQISNNLADPPQDILDIATDMAQKETFQGQTRPPFSTISGPFNSFIGKMLLTPFYKTPSNVFSEIGDRTINPAPLIQAIMKGEGREFDEAMSKLIMGWGIMLYGASLVAGHYGDDVVITGAGPTNKRVQSIIGKGAEVPKASIGIKQKDGSYKWTSFSRMDPLSMTLMMSADMHNYNNFVDPYTLQSPDTFWGGVAEPFEDGGDKMLNALWLAISQHSTDLPFLQGISELQNFAVRPWEDGEKWSERMNSYVAQRFGGIASNIQGQVETFSTLGTGTLVRSYMEKNWPEYVDKYPIIPTNSLLRNIERVVSPESTNSMITSEQLAKSGTMRLEDLSPWMKGFYIAMNQAKGGHYLYSEELSQKLNFWGEPQHQIQPKMIEEYGKWHFMWNPFQKMEGGYSPLDLEIIKIGQVTNNAFDFHPRRLNINLRLHENAKDNPRVYELTGDEFDRHVWAINNIDIYGKVKTNLDLGIEGDGDYDSTLNFRSMLDGLIFGGGTDLKKLAGFDYSMADNDDRWKAISTVLSEFRKKAKKWTLENESRLQVLTDNDKFIE